MRNALREGYRLLSPFLGVVQLSWTQLAAVLAFGVGLAVLDALAFLLFMPLLSGIPVATEWPFLQRVPPSLAGLLANREQRFLWLGGLLMALQTARIFLGYWHHAYSGHLYQHWSRRLADHLFAEWIEFGQGYFDRRGVAGAWRALDARHDVVRVLLGCTRALVNTLVILSHLLVMLLLSAPLTLVTLAFFAAEPVLLGIFSKRAVSLSREVEQQGRLLHAQSYQVLAHLPLYRAYSREPEAVARAQELNQQIAAVSLKGWLWNGWTQRIRGLYASFTVLFMLAFATFVLTPTRMESVLQYLVFFYLLRITLPLLGVFQEVAQEWSAALPRLEELQEILDEGRLSRVDDGRLELSGLEQGIEISHLTFSYGSGAPALVDLCCYLPAGKRIALVGASGSGKSTLARILMGFYPAPAGTVKFDGLPLEQLRRSSLRAHLAWIGQDAIILPASLRENLSFGLEPAPTREQMELALEKAQLSSWVCSLPEGLDSPLADSGANLSGGQKQRIAIARAILKQAPLVILDEATSALDPLTESWIQQSLSDLFAGRTVLIISHRMASLHLAEQVLVLEAGRLVEQGGREELLEAGGHFARLFQSR